MDEAVRLLAFSTAVAVMLVAGTAAAGELRLAWRAPEGCPSGEDVKKAALAAAHEPAEAGGEGLDAVATVERAETWKVHLSTKRGAASGERVLEAKTCRGLADATAVILAVALASPREASTPAAGISTSAVAVAAEPLATPAELAATPPPTPTASADKPAESLPPAQGRSAPPTSLAIGAAGAVQAATLPSAAVGGNLALAWTPGRARIEAYASLWTAQSQTATASDMGARFGMTTIGAAACYTLVKTAFELGPCGGGEAALLDAQGFGAKENYDASAQWAAATFGALGRVPLASTVALRTRLDAVVPLSRPTFIIENGGTVHQPAFFGVRASLGVELHFL